MVGEEIVMMAGMSIKYSLEELKKARDIGRIEEVSWNIKPDGLDVFPERNGRSDKLYKNKGETPEEYLRRILLQNNNSDFMPLVRGIPDHDSGVDITHSLSRVEIELESKAHLPASPYLMRSNKRATRIKEEIKKGNISAIFPVGKKANLKFDLKYKGESEGGHKVIDVYELQDGVVGSKISGDFYTRARVKLPLNILEYDVVYNGWEDYNPKELKFCDEELRVYKKLQARVGFAPKVFFQHISVSLSRLAEGKYAIPKDIRSKAGSGVIFYRIRKTYY